MAFRIAAAFAILCLSALGAQAEELTGLWKAKGHFGVETRGPVDIYKDGATYSADMLGRRVPVRLEAGEFSFELPDRLGSFRGKLEGPNILGHWFRFGTPVNRSDATWPVALSPVLLKPDGANRWRGDVAPLQDDFTFFLYLAEKRPDGSLRAVLRNPEFDFGTQQGVERLVVDGSRVKLIGKRRDKEQEVGVGTYDAENQVITLVLPGTRRQLRFHGATATTAISIRAARIPAAMPTLRRRLVTTAGPLRLSMRPNIDRAAMERFIQKIVDMPMDSTDALQIHGVLIARHGKLVLEEYFHGEHRDKPHMTRSAAKSVTAVIVGAVMQAGAPLKLTSPVYEVMNGGTFPPDLEPQKRAMTLEHLLTMSSGFFCDDNNDDAPGNEETMWDQTAEPDFYRFTMKVPMATPPGENSVYCSASPNLALGMVGRATKELPIYSFDRLIAGPMKIGNYAWPLDPAGNPYGGGGAHVPAARFHEVRSTHAQWRDVGGPPDSQPDFVDRATAPLYHLAQIYYGYNWWSEDFPYKNRNVHAVMALGAGGQIVTVVPELDLVVAFYAGNYSSRGQRDLDTSTSRDISCRPCGKRGMTRARRWLSGNTPVRMATRRTGAGCRAELRRRGYPSRPSSRRMVSSRASSMTTMTMRIGDALFAREHTRQHAVRLQLARVEQRPDLAREFGL